MTRPARTVAVLQSNYLPWKGYFDLIRDVDLFVFYDDVQFTKNDWRNRNRIKTAQGPQWLTVPVGQSLDRRVCDVRLPDGGAWAAKHLRTVRQAYARTPFAAEHLGWLERFLVHERPGTLSELNQSMIQHVARGVLGLPTEFACSTQFTLGGSREDRLLDLLGQVGATRYVSGPSARGYITEERFREANIELVYKRYEYPEYAQLHPPFEHGVSIIDLLMNTGPDASRYIWDVP